MLMLLFVLLILLILGGATMGITERRYDAENYHKMSPTEIRRSTQEQIITRTYFVIQMLLVMGYIVYLIANL